MRNMSQTPVIASIGATLDELGGRWMGGPLIRVGTDLGLDGYLWPSSTTQKWMSSPAWPRPSTPSHPGSSKLAADA
jgi:hypothetical protein